MNKKVKYMVGTMDESVPATCRNDEIAELIGVDWGEALTKDQVDAGFFAAHDIAVSLYGENGDAFIVYGKSGITVI